MAEFLPLVEFALGLLGGIAGSIIFYRWNYRRKGVEAFYNAVCREMYELSERAGNIDQGLIDWHLSSILRLEAHTVFIKTSRPASWKKVKEAYAEYAFEGVEKKLHNYLKVGDTGKQGREGLMELLARLLRRLEEI